MGRVFVVGLCLVALALQSCVEACESYYHVVQDVQVTKNVLSPESLSISFTIDEQRFSFSDVRSSEVVQEQRGEEVVGSRIATANTVCSLSRLAPSLLAASENDLDLRILREADDTNVFSGAILANGDMKYILKPAREVDLTCLKKQGARADLASGMVAYFPHDYVLPFAPEEVVSTRSYYGLEEGASSEHQQMTVFRSTTASPFDYASKDIPPNCPGPVSIAVGAVGQWSFRNRFASDAAACSAIANIMNIASGIFESTVNVKLSLEYAVIMDAASNVGLYAEEKWNSNPCQSTTVQLKSFSSWAASNLPTPISQLFTACGDKSHLAYESIQCQSTSQGASVVNYTTTDVTVHQVAHSFGHNFGASHDQTTTSPSIMYEPVSQQTNLSLHFTRKNQLEMCSHLSTLRVCLSPRDCPSSGPSAGACDVQCGSYTSYCSDGTICQNDKCVVNQTCGPWCSKYGYTCGPDGCGGQCGSVDLVTTKALCDNGQIKAAPRNIMDVNGHVQFLVNEERSSYQVSSAKWDNNLWELQLRNAAACDWNNILWVGTVTGHLNIQAEFAVAVQPSSLYNLANLVSSDIFSTNWICSEDLCVSGNCERYRLFISEQVTGFSCYSQSCSGSSNPFPESSGDWSLIMCGFVGNYAINGHPLANSPFEPPNLSKCLRHGNFSASTQCVPRTCANLQLQCGDVVDDGCGGVIDCGSCPFGSACDDGKCECTPLVTCDSFPNQCGSIWDGCKYIDCSCADSTITCTATEYEPGVCICNTSAACMGYECGTFTTPCGTSVTCGTCGTNYTCNLDNGQCECTLSDCSQVSAYCFVPNGCGGDLYCPPPTLCGGTYNCGVYVDECGKEQYCGNCSGNSVCVNNTCQCIPKQTCLNMDKSCGSFTDDCGVVQDCGSCGSGQVCSEGIDGVNQCVCDPDTFCQAINATCGFVNSSCGYEYCGSCPSGSYCDLNNQCTSNSCTPDPNACDVVECGVVNDNCKYQLCENTCRVPSEYCSGNICLCNSLNACIGRQCGVVNDGCDANNITCGSCDSYGQNYVCSTEGLCVCTPSTCDGRDPGVYNDGCGGVLHCGGSDVPPCSPRDCASFGNPECGQYDDGCGKVIQCGSECAEYEVCYGGVCTCTPGTCDRFSAQCSTIDDGCGGTIDCGQCESPYVCQDTQCICSPIPNVCANRCGVVYDGCKYVDCAYCLEPLTCLFDQSASVTSCFNASCLGGQVWSAKTSSCQCPYGHAYDAVSEQCVLIMDDLVNVCFSESWSIVTGRWLTQARESVTGDDMYTCSTIISAQILNNFAGRADILQASWPLEVYPYMFANLDARGEPATFTFQTYFEYDVRSTFFGVAGLIVDPLGTYVYFVWNANTKYWELGFTNVSGSRAAVVRPAFSAPVQRTKTSMTLQVYRTVTPCAIVYPYVGWAFEVSVGSQTAGPFCFNEVPSHLTDSLFSPTASLPFALLDDGNTLFVSPTYSTATQVSITFWGCLNATTMQSLVAASLSIPESAVSIVSINPGQFCPSPFGQKTDIVFQIYGGSYGTAAGLGSQFLNLVANNLFPYAAHPHFPPSQSPANPVQPFFQVPSNNVVFTYQSDPLVNPAEANPPKSAGSSAHLSLFALIAILVVNALRM